MGGAWAWQFSARGWVLALVDVIAGTAWSIFHILVITLQTFIFMMLTLIYVGQATIY
jgi:F-type H+-transporting ATPase subunit a